MIPYKQLSLTDIYSDCKTFFESDKPKFLSILEDNINLNEFIPLSFYHHFYASTGRPRDYQLHAMLWALIVQRIFYGFISANVASKYIPIKHILTKI